MRPGEGGANCLCDILDGIPTDEIRRRWKAGIYGPEGERPKGEFVKGWLALAGRK